MHVTNRLPAAATPSSPAARRNALMAGMPPLEILHTSRASQCQSSYDYVSNHISKMPGGLNPPPEVLLSWPAPNFINPERHPDTLLYISCIWGPITIIMLFVRMWVRLIQQRNAGWDDWLMVAATILTTALTVLYPLAGSAGLKQHVWDFDAFKDKDKLVRSRKYVLAIECIFCVATGLMKVSILLFYRRLSSRAVSNAFRWTTWITIGYIVAYTIVLTLVPIFGCRPVAAFWEQVDILKRLQGYKFSCFDEGADLFAASIISATQDLLTAVLPTFIYWNLQISKRQKFALFSIFAIGYGVVALGGLRAYFSWRTFYETYDITWSTHDIFITSLLEVHVGAFCANAPTLKGFFKQFFEGKSSPNNSKISKGSGYTSSSGSSMLSKIAAALGGHSRNKSGYIAESTTSVSMDAQGGVQVQRNMDAIRYPAAAIKQAPKPKHDSISTLAMMNSHYYNNDDIELGLCIPTPTSDTFEDTSSVRSTKDAKDLEGFDFTALPVMPTSASSTRSMELPHTTAMYLHPTQSSVAQELEQNALHLAAIEAQKTDFRPPTPTPSTRSVNMKRQWQSWS